MHKVGPLAGAAGERETLAARLGDCERGLHMCMDLAERSMPRAEAEAQLAQLSDRMARLEQLDWRIPPGSEAAVAVT